MCMGSVDEDGPGGAIRSSEVERKTQLVLLFELKFHGQLSGYS